VSTDTVSTNFVGVRIVGGLLPADLLAKLMSGQTPDGLSSKDFHLAAGETVRDAANRVWAYLRGAWTSYRAALAALPDTDAATGLTRERFALVLLDQLGYGRVHPTGKGGLHVGDRGFPVSHLWGNVPIHLLGRAALDTRTKGMAGAAGASPQSMVQELLNRSDEHLWAILANATTLRLVRDSTSLVGSAYVEFDLEAIFDGDLFADFLLLYSLCHVSRLEPRDPEIGPASCWLEHWRQDAIQSGSRALNLLRDGVIQALNTLGSGFLTHPDNAKLRQDLADGEITVDEINHALLRVTYRLLFTFVAEDRNALLDPHADPQVRRRYIDYFSTERLRRTSRRRRGGRYGDRWEALKVVWRGLGSVDGLPELGLPGIGGLFDTGALDFLMDCSLSNQALQSAVHSLSLVKEPRSQAMRIVDYRNLGAEELGSIYESLLELMPSWDPATKTYALIVSSGNQRKDTGSYYTPTSLVESLLDTALDPVLDDAEKSDEPEQALLRITVCDPACGSGHFLVGAARRIAKRVAALRTGDPEPPPEAVRTAIRDVAGRCIYGVDVNPLAAELAKVSLWLEALDPGLPLTFLDAQIRVGNALVGATPKGLAAGLVDAAFKPIEGDDKKVAATWAKQNKSERSAQRSLFDIELVPPNTALARVVEKVVVAPKLSLADVHVQEQRLRAYINSSFYCSQRLAADAWCAAFVWKKGLGAPSAITHRAIVELVNGDDKLTIEQHAELDRLAAQFRFFHWHLEFPHIFPTESAADESINDSTGWYGGFSVVIGNPPWDQIQLDSREFFAATAPEIASNANMASRNRAIEALAEDRPALFSRYSNQKRQVNGLQHFVHESGRFPLTSFGRLNTAPLFAELSTQLVVGYGRAGVVVPTGIATDSFNQYFFKHLVEGGSIASLYDFENRKPLFASVDSRFKFCLLTLTGRNFREPRSDFAFFAQDASDLLRAGTRFSLTPDEIKLLNPNTGTCPVFRSRRDAEITLEIYKRVPILIEEDVPDGNPWDLRLMLMFMMNTDSSKFRTRKELEAQGWDLEGNVFRRGVDQALPLYEGKMVHIFDDRWATYGLDGAIRDVTLKEKQDPSFLPLPRYWVSSKEVDAKLKDRWEHDWLLGWRDICRNTDERTCIVSRFPRTAVGNKLPLILSKRSSEEALALQAMLSSFVFDFVARQKISSTSMNFYIFMQLAALPPQVFLNHVPWNIDEEILTWISERVRRLESWRSLDDRAVARAELDALFFHLYGIDYAELDYIMETFHIVKRKDIAKHGEYRTKRLILETFERLFSGKPTHDGPSLETQRGS
jgi:hypothetical protein